MYKTQYSPRVTVKDRELQSALDTIILDTQREFLAVQKSSSDSTPARTVVSISGGGGSSSVSGLQAGVATVGTSATVVTLTSSVTSYIVLFRCVNSANETVGCDITSISSGSFVATALETATLYWAIFPI